MRRVNVISFALLALAACSILTEIPDDVMAGGPRSPDASLIPNDGGGPMVAQPNGDAATQEPSQDAGGSPDATTNGVALDAIGPSTNGTGGAGKTSPLVWTHTTSGANRALFVSVAIGHDPDDGIDVSVTYEGAALTRVAIQHSNNKNSGFVTLWALANPPNGAHPVSVAFTGSPGVITAGSISFTGVDQSTPYQNVAKGGGSSNSAKLEVASATRHMVVGAVVAGCALKSSGQSGWIKNVSCDTGGGNGAQAAALGAPSVNLTYAVEADWWGIIGADVKAAP